MTYLKKITTLFCIIFSISQISAQEQISNKPSIMYIFNGEEISEAKVQKFIEEGRLKEMQKGISEDARKLLVEKYGDKAKDSFIAVITTFSDKEMLEKEKQNGKKETSPKTEIKEETTLVHAGDLPPDFTVEMLDGRKIKLSELRGKVVLLNFWATWCAPCMMEFYEIPEKILKRFAGKEFVFLPISRQEKREVVAKKMEKLKEKGIDFPVGIDPERKIYSMYAKQTIPRNFLIGKDGKVVFTSIGYTKKELEELAEKIEELLK